MSERTSAHLAYALAGLALLVTAAGVVFLVLTRHIGATDTTATVASDALGAATVVAFVVIGTLVAARRSRNPIGWVFLWLGILTAVGLVVERYAIYVLLVNPGWADGGTIAAALQANAYLIFLTFFLLLILLFPTGKVPGRLWRLLIILGAGTLLGAYAVVSMKPGTLGEPFDAFRNPLGVEALSGIDGPLTALLVVTGVFIVLAAVVSAVLRFRRSRGVERAQFKWFALAAALVGVGLLAHSIADAFAPGAIDPIEFLVSLAVAGLPIAAGVAILRYRLYEIDRIINRALVYGVLTAGLAGLYFGIVLALQQVFSSFAGGSELAVAGSTLVVAALFRPVRGRVQMLVDRRFYRQRYDAQRTLEAFTVRLRDEVDLATLGADLGTVVHETMQPAHVSLWLRRQSEER